jgi:hypothetical protein
MPPKSATGHKSGVSEEAHVAAVKRFISLGIRDEAIFHMALLLTALSGGLNGHTDDGTE